MAGPLTDIERVVREVLAELGVAPPAGGSEDGELVLGRRVVTLAELPERLDGVRRVVVPPGAVVTPSVRDELKRRHVDLIHADPQAGKDPERAVAAVVSMDSAVDPAPLVKALETEGFAVELRRMDCLIRATDELAREIAGGRTQAVLLTRHAAAALCLANRLAGVRAVRGTSAETVATEADAVGANLLVVDTSAASVFAARQTALRFLRGGVRQCPEVFRKRLG